MVTASLLAPADHENGSGEHSKAGIRSTRFYALDMIRLVAMLFMIQGHALDALVVRDQLDVTLFPWSWWHFLRGLTAPLFLLVSGAVHVFANRRDAQGRIADDTFWRRIRWGLSLIGIGYLLSFPADNLNDFFWLPADYLRHFWQINILQLTGLALILLMIVLRATRSTASFSRSAFAVAVLITFLTPFVNGDGWQHVLPAFLVGYMTFDYGSVFPLFPFGAYLFIGVLIGRFLQNTPPERRVDAFAPRMLIAGALLLIIAVGTDALPWSLYPEYNYWHSSPNLVLIRTALSLIIMAALGYIYKFTQGFNRHYALLGSKALHIYVGHLVLLFGTPWLAGIAKTHYRSLSLGEGILAALVLSAVCIGLVYLMRYCKERTQNVWTLFRSTAAAALFYALMF